MKKVKVNEFANPPAPPAAPASLTNRVKRVPLAVI